MPGVRPPEFRLPDDTRVGAVHLQVSDLARSLEYYERGLGFRVYERAASSATLGPHGEERPLVTLRTSAGVVPARRGALGLYHFAILLPHRAALGQFAAHLSRIRARAGMADHLVSEALYLWDPDGLGIEVYADRPRSTWKAHDGELMMTTDPLDIDDVIAAGGDAVWEGMPAGTTIGHVHLHVGTLDEAEAFYHRALGFDKMVWSYPGALFLAAGGYHHHLGTNIWAHGASAQPHEARLVEWELLVPSPDARAHAARHLRNSGYTIAEDGLTADPWGTAVRLTGD